MFCWLPDGSTKALVSTLAGSNFIKKKERLCPRTQPFYYWLRTQAVPADALVLPTQRDQGVPLLNTKGEVVSTHRRIGVVQTMLHRFRVVGGVEGDALVVPAFGHQLVLFRLIHGVQMLTGAGLEQTVYRRAGVGGEGKAHALILPAMADQVVFSTSEPV